MATDIQPHIDNITRAMSGETVRDAIVNALRYMEVNGVDKVGTWSSGSKQYVPENFVTVQEMTDILMRNGKTEQGEPTLIGSGQEFHPFVTDTAEEGSQKAVSYAYIGVLLQAMANLLDEINGERVDSND